MQSAHDVEVELNAAAAALRGWQLRDPPASYGADPPKLLDRLRLALRARHYSRRTEAAYVHWVRSFVLFHG